MYIILVIQKLRDIHDPTYTYIYIYIEREREREKERDRYYLGHIYHTVDAYISE